MTNLLENYLTILTEFGSGDIIKVKNEIQGKKHKITPGKYEVVEMWEDGALITTPDNNRYFIRNKDLNKIEKIGRYNEFEEFK